MQTSREATQSTPSVSVKCERAFRKPHREAGLRSSGRHAREHGTLAGGFPSLKPCTRRKGPSSAPRGQGQRSKASTSQEPLSLPLTQRTEGGAGRGRLAGPSREPLCHKPRCLPSNTHLKLSYTGRFFGHRNVKSSYE